MSTWTAILIAVASSLGALSLQGLGKIFWRWYTDEGKKEKISQYAQVAEIALKMKEQNVSAEDVETLTRFILSKDANIDEFEETNQLKFETKIVSYLENLKSSMTRKEYNLLIQNQENWELYRDSATRTASYGYSSAISQDFAYKVEDISILRDRITYLENEIDFRDTKKSKQSPIIAWRSNVGSQAWRNGYIISGPYLYATSAGSRWNEPDDADGMYCISRATGEVLWHTHTPADANGLALAAGVLITGCDDGSLIAVNPQDGTVRWQRQLASGVISTPQLMPLPLGSKDVLSSEASAQVAVATYGGDIHIFDVFSGEDVSHISVGFVVNTEILVQYEHPFPNIVVFGVSGEVQGLHYNVDSRTLWKGKSLKLSYHSEYSESGSEPCEFSGNPKLYNGFIYIGFSRNTTYSFPPIYKIGQNLDDFDLLSYHDDNYKFGNIRTSITVFENNLIVCPAYSNKLVAIDLNTQVVSWSVDLGETTFPQWSSPILYGSKLYVGRIDGYMYGVDLRKRSLDWAIFLGRPDLAGSISARSPIGARTDASGIWSSPFGHPILSTPIADNGEVFVGLGNGDLYCVEVEGGS